MKKGLFLSLLFSTLITTTGMFLRNKPCDGEVFDGKARAEAKTSIGVGDVEEITIEKFIEKYHDKAALNDNSPRSTLEQNNVTVTGWLYTYAREDDEDFHIILGSSPNATGRKFISAEISGLPKNNTSSSYTRLKKARDDFKAIILNDGNYCSNFTTKLLKTPIKVTVTGSIFYDTHHAMGGSGTMKKGISYKSKTPWEIHPVTDIHLGVAE